MEDKENFPPLSKKCRVSLSFKSKKKTSEQLCSSKRFAEPTSSSELETAVLGVVPQNTAKNNQWALKNWNDWRISRSVKEPNELCLENLLSTTDAGLLCKWFSFFVMETLQSSDKPYPPKTLYSLLCGLLRVSCEKGCSLNFLDKSDMRFQQFHRTMDSVFCQLHADVLVLLKNRLMSSLLKMKNACGKTACWA